MRGLRRSAGHTRWTRFAGVMSLGGLAAGVLAFGMSQGAIAASFAASGSVLKVNADSLTGNGITGYGGEIRSSGGAKEAVTLGVDSATVSKLCGEFTVGSLPLLGAVSIGIVTPSAEAEDLIADVGGAGLGKIEIKNAKVGFDASAIGGKRGSTGLSAATAKASDLDGESWSASAGTLRASGIKLALASGGKKACG